MTGWIFSDEVVQIECLDKIDAMAVSAIGAGKEISGIKQTERMDGSRRNRFCRVKIPAYSDKITVRIDGHFEKAELPFVFITGKFKVHSEQKAIDCGHQWKIKAFYLCPEDDDTDPCDLVQSGYPFLAEPVLLRKRIRMNGEKSVRFERIRADAAYITIQNRQGGVLKESWVIGPDWSINDIHEEEGEDEVTPILYPSTFNTYGPHHHYEGDRHLTSPLQYSGKRMFADWPGAPEYTLIPEWYACKFGIEGEYDETDKNRSR